MNEARFFQHELHKIIIRELVRIHAHLLEAGAAVIEHFGGRPFLQQIFDLRVAERVPEKITIVDLRLLLREELPRLTAGGSSLFTIEINFHGQYHSLSAANFVGRVVSFLNALLIRLRSILLAAALSFEIEMVYISSYF